MGSGSRWTRRASAQAKHLFVGGCLSRMRSGRLRSWGSDQGQEGLELVEKSVESGRPYAMTFVDVRMPPGWDGIETTAKLWSVCPDLQVDIRLYELKGFANHLVGVFSKPKIDFLT